MTTPREILIVNTALRHTEFVKVTKEALTEYFRGTRLFDLYAVDGDKVIRFQSDADWKSLYTEPGKFDDILNVKNGDTYYVDGIPFTANTFGDLEKEGRFYFCHKEYHDALKSGKFTTNW